MTSRPLSELSPMGIRRNSPKFDQVTKVRSHDFSSSISHSDKHGQKPMFSTDSSPFERSPAPAKYSRDFWQGHGASSPTRLGDDENTSTPSSGRRASLERLQKSSRVKNSNMFARENSTIYDPDSSVIVPERPLAAGRPLSVVYSGNNWEMPTSPGKATRHARNESQTQIPILSPAKNTSSPSSPFKHSTSPHKSSLSQRYPDDDCTGSSTPRGSQQSKTVAFDTAPPQVNEYEMITPDPSSIASGSREGSYDLDEFDPDDSYEENQHHEDSFDESLEDTGKTPVVLPEDWRFMSPKNANKGLANTFDDPFDEEHEPASPLGHRKRRDVSDVSHADSLNSEGERRPLPPLPAKLSDSPKRSSLRPGMSVSPRHEPSPPRPASMSKAEILGMRNSPMPLDERLRLLALQEHRPTAEDQLECKLEEPSEDKDDDYEVPHISRESILRKIKAQREASDDYASDDTVEAPTKSYADVDPDEPIPSRETSANHVGLDEDDTVKIKHEEEDERDLNSYSPIRNGFSPARSEFELESSVIHHYIPDGTQFDFGLGSHDDNTEDEEDNDLPVQSIEQGLVVPTTESHRMSLPEFTTFGSAEDDFDFGLRDYISPPPESSLSQNHVSPATDSSKSMETPPTSSQLPESQEISTKEIEQSPEEQRPSTPVDHASFQDSIGPREASTPDSVIHHSVESFPEDEGHPSSPEPIPEPEATVRAPGGRLKVRASNTVAELQSLRAAAFDDDLSASDESRPGTGSSGSLLADVELSVEQTNELKRQLSDKMKLDLQVGDDLGFGLEKEFDRLVEAQKRGYLMRQNTKVVVASHRQVSDEQKNATASESKTAASPLRKNSARKTSGSKIVTTEPWNGKMRRQSSRRSNIGVAMGPVPPLPGQESNVLASVAETSLLEEQEEGVERGRLFVKVVGVKNLDLPLPRGERNWFQLTLDNGLHCVTTAWLELGKNAPIGQEFELTVFNELDFSLTLQTKALERPKSSASSVDSLLKSPNKKPSAFSRLLSSPKKRREMDKKQEEQAQARQKEMQAQQTALQPTAWDLLHDVVGADGSFARAVVSLDDHEQQAFGRQHTVDIPCFNSWATEDVQTTRSKHGGIQRRPPYKIGELELQLLYIPKPKGVEDKDMPTSMSSCLRNIKEAEIAASRQYEGFLSQQGGDCPVAKATKLIDEKSSLQKPEGALAKGSKSRRRSAFAEEEEGYMFIEEGFRIRFANGEVIDFYADSTAEKDSWMVVLADAVGKESATQKTTWTSAVLARRKLRGDTRLESEALNKTSAGKSGSRSVPNSPQKPQPARPNSMIYEKPLPVEKSEKFPSRPSSKSSASPSKTSSIPRPGSPTKAPESPSKKIVPALTTDKSREMPAKTKSARRAAAADELHLGGAGAGDEAGVAGDGLDDVDGVVDGALEVVEVVLRGAAQDEGRGARGRGRVLAHEGDAVAAELERLDDVDAAHLVGHGGAEAGEGCGADDGAQAAQVELAEDLEHEDAVPVEVVLGQLADRRAGDEDAQAGVVQLLDRGLKLRLLALGEVEHLLGVVQQDGALGFGLRDVDRAGEDADLGLGGLLDGAGGLAAKDHAAHDARLLERAAHDLDDTDVVDVEAGRVLGQDGEHGLGDHGGEQVFAARLLGGDDGAQGLAELLVVANVLDRVDDEILQGLDGKGLRLLVALHNVARLEAHAQQLFGLLQQLTRKDHDEICGVAHLGLLLLAGHDDELCSGVNNVKLSENGGSVACFDIAEDCSIFGVVAVGVVCLVSNLPLGACSERKGGGYL
ncbi:hypothetical protein FH972_026669 [Carpinus fangiana]|uniref:Anillin homology domain-containing protein n=1 Tax=Carpinus fangiana TaxID=176857 RepID=A0A5N6L770_9ROSI|nr:hypothetical protein FH972_026669 [Carpinus fangiana]